MQQETQLHEAKHVKAFSQQQICILGLGYIGLPTASLLATKGFDVTGVDITESVVNNINQGKVHIVEPDLDILVKSATKSGQLTASLQAVPADIFIIAVPTPLTEDKKPDVSHVLAAAEVIAPLLEEGNLIILESTSPVGTTDKIKSLVQSLRPELEEVYFAYCPERVIPGKVLKELVENDRIVGGVDAASTQQACEFYQQFVSGQVLATDAKTAELCKLTENAFRDVNIAFANELSMISDKLDIDVWELIRLANHHPRVNILQPGPGVGGHCIAVDPWFIHASAPEQSALVKTARNVNDSKPQWVIEQVKAKAAQLMDPVIACLGVTFKPDIDDMRESPALEIVQALKHQNVGRLMVVEPHVKSLSGFDVYSAADALEAADIVLILVDHSEFKLLPRELFDTKCVIDTKGMLS